MGALAKFEAFVENLLEGSLTRVLRGQLQPVEIAKRLARALDDSKTVGVGRVFVANEYRVRLSVADFQRLESVRATLERELAEYVMGVARERGFSMVAKPIVRLDPSDDLAPRQMQVEARLSESPSCADIESATVPSDFGQTMRFSPEQVKRSLKSTGASALLVSVDQSEPLGGQVVDKPVVTIGRALANDIVIDDARVSRYHAEIRAVGGKYCLYDLKSTNGTWVNGRKVTESVLTSGDMVSFGGVEFRFDVPGES